MTESVRSTRYPIDARAQRIIAAAFAEFTRRGVGAARMSAIARYAGVSLATLRQYFPTREELFREVIRSTIVRLIRHSPEADTPTTGQPIVGRIRHFLRQFWRTMEEPEQAALLRLALGELSAFPELAVFHTTEVFGRAVGRLEAMLSEGVRSGEIQVQDVRTAARVILAALITYALWLASPALYADLTGPDRERAEDSAIEILVGALGGSAPPEFLKPHGSRSTQKETGSSHAVVGEKSSDHFVVLGPAPEPFRTQR
jgi:TetR/AcrR family transcriptional regulator